MSDHALLPLLLLAAGVIGGALNVVAGGGSFLTLPLLIFTGLPPGVANGTNRIGILLQNMGAVWSFRRRGVSEPGWAFTAGVPSILGAIAGTLVATWMADDLFRQVLSWLMIVMSLWTLWDPIGRRRAATGSPAVRLGWMAMGGFFLAGMYGGFVQAGVGFILLAITTLAGYDLVRGNSLKVLCVMISTPVSLAIFAWNDQVAWVPGLTLAAGMMAGGMLGAHLTVLKGHLWVRGVVTAAVIAMALKLLLGA
jgi:uncharacterized membrane protein YfcA